MRNLLFVVCHKNMEFPQKIHNSPYHIVAVGPGKDVLKGPDIWTDDVGENISEKNAHYCELTAHYWVWKNKMADYDNIGLCHYQRFFTRNGFSVDPKYYLNDQDIDALMAKYDVVVPKTIYFAERNCWRQPCYLNLGELLRTHYPAYFEPYNTVIHGNSGTLYNMFIMRKKYFQEYSEWMFDVLARYEQLYPATEDNKRIYGYLSEQLFDAWLRYKNLKIKRLPIAYPGGGEKYQRKWAIRSIFHLNGYDLHQKFGIKRKEKKK